MYLFKSFCAFFITLYLCCIYFYIRLYVFISFFCLELGSLSGPCLSGSCLSRLRRSGPKDSSGLPMDTIVLPRGPSLRKPYVNPYACVAVTKTLGFLFLACCILLWLFLMVLQGPDRPVPNRQDLARQSSDRLGPDRQGPGSKQTDRQTGSRQTVRRAHVPS